MIYPDKYKVLKVIDKDKCDVNIYLYHKVDCIFSGKIRNITPERFNRLNRLLEELIKINNSQESLIFGIVEIQQLIKETK